VAINFNVLGVHERLYWKLFEGHIGCHSTGLQAGREEYVNPEGEIFA